MKIIGFVIELFKKYPQFCVANILLNIAMSLFAVCSLFSLGPIVDLFIHPDRSGISPLTQKAIGVMSFLGLPVSLVTWLVIFLVFTTISCGLQVLAWQSVLHMQFAIQKDATIGSFEDFFNAKWQFFSSSEQGTLYNTFNRELSLMGSAFSALGQAFAGIVQVVILLMVPFVISWKVTLVSFAVGLAFSSFFFLLGGLAYKLGKKNTEVSNKLTSLIYENISGAKLVLGYGNQDRALKDVDEAFKKYCEACHSISGPELCHCYRLSSLGGDCGSCCYYCFQMVFSSYFRYHDLVFSFVPGHDIVWKCDGSKERDDQYGPEL